MMWLEILLRIPLVLSDGLLIGARGVLGPAAQDSASSMLSSGMLVSSNDLREDEAVDVVGDKVGFDSSESCFS
jgi:hypothetical protein